MLSQVRKSARTKQPSQRQREFAQMPPYRRNKRTPDPSDDTSNMSDSATSRTASEEPPSGQQRIEDSDNDSLTEFEKIVTFEASQSVCIGKEKIYSKSVTCQLEKWNPEPFEDRALSKARDDADALGWDIHLRSKTAFILANGKKATENSVEDEDDIARVNNSIRSLFLNGAKNIRLEYVIQYSNVTPSASSKRLAAAQSSQASVKRCKVPTTTLYLALMLDSYRGQH